MSDPKRKYRRLNPNPDHHLTKADRDRVLTAVQSFRISPVDDAAMRRAAAAAGLSVGEWARRAIARGLAADSAQ